MSTASNTASVSASNLNKTIRTMRSGKKIYSSQKETAPSTTVPAQCPTLTAPSTTVPAQCPTLTAPSTTVPAHVCSELSSEEEDDDDDDDDDDENQEFYFEKDQDNELVAEVVAVETELYCTEEALVLSKYSKYS